MGTDHRRCDGLFADAEGHVGAGRWADAAMAFRGFVAELERHFTMEEEVAFPAFEQQTGMTEGPTTVMRMEHTQMRQAAREMSDALDAQDADTFLGLSDTFMLLMQQHNMKEEQILYPMIDRTFGTAVDDLITRMREA